MPPRVAPPPRPTSFDLRLCATTPWWTRQRLQEAAEVLREQDLVLSWQTHGADLHLQLDDEALERSDSQVIDGLAPGRLLVQFCDPNTTKALHLGHLRNIALGHAVAAMHEVAGWSVTRQSVVCDFGRGMSEAMAGWATAPKGQESIGKPDHAVGRQYARYVQELKVSTENGVGPADQPVAREATAGQDLAHHLLTGWLEGDPRVRRLWAQVRNLVLQGHEETMARLGVRFDRKVYESEWCHLNDEILRRGLESGLFEVNADEDVIYRTGLEEQEEITLLRRGVGPTVHLRTLAVWVGIDPCLDGMKAILVGGDEWITHDICIENVLAAYLGEERVCARPTHITYGMVHQDGSLMKSSTGDATLIDGILDALEKLVTARYHHLSDDFQRGLAAKAALGSFLGYPMQETLDLDLQRLSDPTWNLALRVLDAWVEARCARTADSWELRGALGVSDARWLLIQSHWTQCCAAEARERLDPRMALRCYAYLASWYQERPRPAEVSNLASKVLGQGLAALGLAPEKGADSDFLDQMLDSPSVARAGL